MIGGVGCVTSAEGEARFICAVAIRHLAPVLRTKYRDGWGGGRVGATTVIQWEKSVEPAAQYLWF